MIAFAAVSSLAHQRTTPQILPSTLDQGLHIEIKHPRVIRESSPFTLSVSVGNMVGDDDLIVTAVRYTLPSTSKSETHSVHAPLPPNRDTYLRYLQLETEIEASTGVEQTNAMQRRTRQLAYLHRAAFEDSFSIDAYMIPAAGETLTVDVFIDLQAGDTSRTVRRTLSIPVQQPLPNGASLATRYRFNAAHGVLEQRPAPRTKPRDASSNLHWFSGDQHLHTRYSMDAAATRGTGENVADYAAIAEAGGLDWIIATEHSNVDFNFLGLAWYTPAQHAAGAFEAALYTATHDFLALSGQEMGAGAGFPLGMPSHYLAYPALTDSTGFLENPCSGYIFNVAFCEPYQMIIDRVAQAGGVGFIAHPADAAIAKSPWNFQDTAVGWAGLEIWNSSSGSFGDSDRSAYEIWHALLREVRRPVNGQLLPRPGIPSRFPVGIGNSDAHEPSSIGATFTYAQMESVTRPNVIGALLSGRAVASNGPLLYGDINGAGIGGVATGVNAGTQLSITLHTTPEFGPVSDYTLTVNVNGIPRTVIPLPGDTDYSTTIVVDGLDFALPDKFVTLRADSVNGRWRAFTNPIWLELPPCVGDVNEDMVVDVIDLILVWLTWGPCQGCPTDINRDGTVNFFDFIEVLFRLGPCAR